MEAALGALVQVIGSAAVTEAVGSLNKLLHVPRPQNLETKLRRIGDEFESMQAFLREAEERKGTTTPTESTIEVTINQVRELAYRVEDILDELMGFVHSRSGGGMRGAAHNLCHFPEDMHIGSKLASKIDDVYSQFQGIVTRSAIYHILGSRQRANHPHPEGNLPPSCDQTKTMVGMASNNESLVEWLTSGDEHLSVMSVWGMGGLGKTTLARAAWDHPKVKKSFENRVWVTMSQYSTLRELLQNIDQELLKDAKVHPHQIRITNEDTLRRRITSVLSRSRYIIVLDDIWNSSILETLFSIFPCNSQRGRVLVTTRSQEVASYLPQHLINVKCHSLELEPLPKHEARELFFLVAFGRQCCPRFLEDSSAKIIEKCNGLPLALVTIARVMASNSKRGDVEEWERVHRCLQWELTNNKELQTMTRTLMLSYNHLPYNLKRCFLYCAVFPRGYKIRVKMLVLMWIAQGLIDEVNDGKTMEDRARDLLEQLVYRSMLQVVKRNDAGQTKVCRMHDLMRDLAIAATSTGEYICAEPGKPVAESIRARHLTILEASERPQHLTALAAIRRSPHLTTLPASRRPSTIKMTNTIGLHSMLFSGNCLDVRFWLQSINLGLRFLRVLHLTGVNLDEVPDIIFSLVNLRYLSCRETQVSRIPSLLGNLYNLQTLDLRRTNIDHLPRELIKLQKLRHLLLDEVKDPHKLKYKNVFGWRGSEAPSNISDLKQLQTLRSIRADKHLISQLEYLTQLRSLTITEVESSNNVAFCNCISKISHHLTRLSVKASPGHTMELGAISSPPRYLRKFILRGSLASIPEWFTLTNSLTHLYLFDSKLGAHKNLIPDLQCLRNLVVLALDDASRVPHLMFDVGDFPALRTLSIMNTAELQKMEIRKGAVPCLRLLHVQACKFLRCILGLEYLMELNELKLKELDVLDNSRIPKTLQCENTF